MKFSIIILDNFYDMFLDLAYQLQYYLNGNKYENEIVNYSENIENNSSNKYIFFGTAYKNFKIPNGSILTMFDNIKTFDNTFPPYLLENNTILHYNQNEISLLKLKYPFLKIHHFKMGYAQTLDFSNLKTSENIPFQYDICFIGNLSERRKNILNELSSKGYKVYAGGYHPYFSGIRRARLFHSSKIVLSIYTNEDTFDCSMGSRVIPAVSNKNFVIVETSTNELNNEFMKKIAVVANYDNIVEKCIYYLNNENERIDKENIFYENIKQTIVDIGDDITTI